MRKLLYEESHIITLSLRSSILCVILKNKRLWEDLKKWLNSSSRIMGIESTMNCLFSILSKCLRYSGRQRRIWSCQNWEIRKIKKKIPLVHRGILKITMVPEVATQRILFTIQKMWHWGLILRATGLSILSSLLEGSRIQATLSDVYDVQRHAWLLNSDVYVFVTRGLESGKLASHWMQLFLHREMRFEWLLKKNQSGSYWTYHKRRRTQIFSQPCLMVLCAF